MCPPLFERQRETEAKAFLSFDAGNKHEISFIVVTPTQTHIPTIERLLVLWQLKTNTHLLQHCVTLVKILLSKWVLLPDLLLCTFLQQCWVRLLSPKKQKEEEAKTKAFLSPSPKKRDRVLLFFSFGSFSFFCLLSHTSHWQHHWWREHSIQW